MYEQFYGLSGRPFQLTPDPEFYFESVSQKKALSYLGYGLAQGEGFIVITGEVGAGKSTLVAHLMERVDPAELTVGKIVTSALDGEEIVHVVAQSFGLEVEGRDKASALGLIERFLAGEARAGRRCLLVVDECQNLDIEAIEELRMLSNFQLGAHPLLQTLLLGQPEFRRLIASHPELEQLRQRVIASHHLDALQPGELKAYVTHRLEQVGWSDKPVIDGEFFAALYDTTAGIPRRINQIMNRLLLLGAIEEREQFTAAMLEAVRAEMDGDGVNGARALSAQEHTPPVSFEAAFKSAKPASSSACEQQGKTDLAPAAPGLAAPSLAGAEKPPREKPLDTSLETVGAAVDAAGGDAPSPRAPRARAPGPEGRDMGELREAIAQMEERLDEHEESVRYILSLLIEWFEDETQREAA